MARGRAAKEMMQMQGDRMMMKKPKKSAPKKQEDMMQYSDLGGMNFDPKKMPKKRK